MIKTITTSNGHIVNLAQIAMITVGAGRSETNALTIHFPAALSAHKGARSMRLSLAGDEAKDFLRELKKRGVAVKKTLEAFEKKPKESKPKTAKTQ